MRVNRSEATEADYGTWESPITASDCAVSSRSMTGLIADNDDLLWLEPVADPEPRTALVRYRDGAVTIVSPAPVSVRSRVNAYGGGAHHAHGGWAVWVDGVTDEVKVADPAGSVSSLTAHIDDASFADVRIYPERGIVLAVREAHDSASSQSLVALSIANGTITTVVDGADFYANPELAPDGRLAWLEWNLPHMPWESTALWIGQLNENLTLANRDLIAGGDNGGIAVHHPAWLPDGSLRFTHDASGFFQVVKYRDGQTSALHSTPNDFDLPMFILGNYAHDHFTDGRVATTYYDDGVAHLAVIGSNGVHTLASAADVDSVAVANDMVYAIIDQPASGRSLVRLPNDASLEVIRTISDVPDPDVTSVARSLVFQGRYGQVQAWYYPPTNTRYVAPTGQRPPMILRAHGGPIDRSTNAYYPDFQFWTSRGIAVMDVNYSGSTGFGRSYRQRLNGMWGVADVDDCVDAAEMAVDAGLADPGKIVIMGSSAGGFTALRAVSTSDRFAAAISRYGVTDLEALIGGPKFESRSTETLVGPWPEAKHLYTARSPIHNVEQIAHAILLLQGTDDPIVPPDHATRLADAARKAGIYVELHMYEAEGHGFRSEEARIHALETQLAFVAKICGFTPAE